MDENDESSSAGGVQSIEAGARILNALANLRAAPMLKTIAEHANMPPSKAHRYLTSFVRTGMVARDQSTGRYQFGPLAIRIGLIALRRIDVVQIAGDALTDLREEVGHSVFLAVWGDHGPTIVRAKDSDDPLVVSSRPGSILPIVPSSTGRLFGAYLPRVLTRQMIERDLKTGRAGPSTMREVEEMFDDVRARRLSRTLGELNPGVHSIAAPIFNHEGELVAVISTLGVVGAFDGSWDGPVAQKMLAASVTISKQLAADD